MNFNFITKIKINTHLNEEALFFPFFNWLLKKTKHYTGLLNKIVIIIQYIYYIKF